MVKWAPDTNWTDYKYVSAPILSIDATDPNNLSQTVLDERKTRSRILSHSRLVGCERDMLLLFAKFDKQMKACANSQERKDIAKLACYEVYRLLGGGGQLFVGGQMVCDDRTPQEKAKDNK